MSAAVCLGDGRRGSTRKTRHAGCATSWPWDPRRRRSCAAADEAGIPWHVVYRAKGIAGADCGRVGGGAGSYFVWSLFDLPEEVEESQESAKSSIENTKTGEESAEREEVPDLVDRGKCKMRNAK